VRCGAGAGEVGVGEAGATSAASTFEPVSAPAAARPVRARLGTWPDDGGVAHLVLLDHHMVPSEADVDRWIDQARRGGARAIRTGALFEPSTPAFFATGFTVIDRLALLQLDLNRDGARSTKASDRPSRLRRLRPSMLDGAAAVDRRAFSPPWGNDRAALRDVMTATPQQRSRCVLGPDGRMIAFSISGRAGAWGYVQRLAVEPDAQRRGLARLLVDDALRWMHRRRVTHVLVNTAIDNVAALELYREFGFRTRPDGLAVLERHLPGSTAGT
jgi:[ribosomal protein S18]-alanine N-acetyltransferase